MIIRKGIRGLIRGELSRCMSKGDKTAAGKSKTRRKREFSKAHVIFADALVAFVYVTNMILSFLDKVPISDLAVTIVTIYGGFATGGYFTLCAVRDTSLNKHHLRINKDGNGNEYKEELTNINYDDGGSAG